MTSSAVVALLAAAAMGAAATATRIGLYVVYTVALAMSALALTGGLAVRRVPRADPWWLIGAGIGCIAVQIGLLTLEVTGVVARSGASLLGSTLFQLAGYVLLIMASVRFVRLRTGVRDRDGLIDASLVGCASAVVLWQWTTPQDGVTPAAVMVVGAVPAVLLATVLALSVRLLFAASDVVAARLVVLATAASLVGNLVNLTGKLAGEMSAVAVCWWILSQAALVAASFHPSRPLLTRRPDVERSLLTARLGVLGLALAAIPVSTVLLATSRRVVPVVGTVLVTALVLWRLGRSLHERERRAGQQALLFDLGQLAVAADRHTLYAAAVAASARITGAPAAAAFELGGREPGLVAHVGAWPPDLTAAEQQELAAAAGGTVVLREEPVTLVPFGPAHEPLGIVAVAGRVEGDLGRGSLLGVAQILGQGVRRLQAEAELLHTSVHDALTGLPNRVLLYERLTVRVARAGRSSDPFAVMFVDLDGFKSVNDSLGHAAGDLILRGAADRLRVCVRPSDLVARVSGDEFVVLLEVADGEVAEMIAGRVTAALSEPTAVGPQLVTVSASIGVVVVSGSEAAGLDVDRLLRDADELMYEVKRSGRDGYRIASPTERAAHPVR